MSEFWIKVIINIIIGFIVVFGFLGFWGRSAGWFKEGGIIYEYRLKKKMEKIQRKMEQNPDAYDDYKDDE